jgi:hypothetical protein
MKLNPDGSVYSLKIYHVNGYVPTFPISFKTSRDARQITGVESLHVGTSQGNGQPSVGPVAGHGASPHGRNEWPGKRMNVREPHPGETALSWEEVNHGFIYGVL